MLILGLGLGVNRETGPLAASSPAEQFNILTETGDDIVTETGDEIVTEDAP